MEVEFSLWATDILHNDVAKTCAELNIPIVAYSPLGRGILTGQITKFADIPEGDFRRILPKYQDEALKDNLKLVHAVVDLAKRKGIAPGQIALAWILTLSNRPGLPTMIPIPGGTTSDKVIQNTQVEKLSDQDMEELDTIVKTYEVKGERYPTH